MKRRIIIGLLLCALLCGCTMAEETTSAGAALQEQAEATAAAPTPSPAATPTTSPTQSPTPIPAPKINADWYIERREEMTEHLRQFGGYTDEEEIQQILFRREIDPNRPMIALTFDDGPVAEVTNGVLDVLEEYDARATFFICGYRLFREENSACLRRMLALGCEIGNHTFEHEYLPELTEKNRRDTIRKTNRKIAEMTDGYAVKSLRPPGGKSNGYVIREARKQNMAVVLWSQSGNVHLADPRAIADNVQQQEVDGRELQNGDIVLLHDTKDRMVEAVQLMVPELLEQGYQLVTVQELLSLSQPGFTPGIQYRSMTDYK